jgi:hypothetical protein
MAAAPFTGDQEGSEVLAPPGPTLVKKKKPVKWNQGSDIGRWKLALGCVVPTTYKQKDGGKHCSAGKKHKKGDLAKNGGKTFKVNPINVNLILLALASQDDGKRQVFPGNDWLVEYTGVKIRSVINALNALAQAGFLRKTSRGFRMSKKYWLNWDLIQGRQIKWASKVPGQTVEVEEEQTEEQEETAYWEEITKPKPVEHKQPKVASGYNEPNPVADPLVAILIESLELHGKSSAINQGTIGPVVRQLLKRHPDRLEQAIQSIDCYQYKCIAGANSPAAYLRGTLDNQLSMSDELLEEARVRAVAEREQKPRPSKQPVKPPKVERKPAEKKPKKSAGEHPMPELYEEWLDNSDGDEEPNQDDYEEAEEPDYGLDDDEDDKRYQARVEKANREAEEEIRKYRF